MPRLSTSLLIFSLLLSFSISSSAHSGHHDDNDEQNGVVRSPSLQSKVLVRTKIWCLILVFVGTFVGGLSPYFFKWDERFLVLGTQFAGGVFLGTALMHFLSDANDTFRDLTTKEYPFAFMLACVGFLLTLLADCVVSHVFAKENGGGGDVEVQGRWVLFYCVVFCEKKKKKKKKRKKKL